MTVKIPGRRGRWTLMCHCLNRETGSEWLDIYGGPAAHQTVRSFKADAVVLPATRRKRRRAEPVDI